MSLVNKMLRDLDARSAGAGERGSIPLTVSPLPGDDEKTTRWGPLTVFAVIGLSLSAAIQFNLLPIGNMGNMGSIGNMGNPVNAGKPAAPAVVAVVAPPPVPAPVSAPAPEPIPAPPAEATPATATAVSPAPTLAVSGATTAPAPVVEAGLRIESALLSPPPLSQEAVAPEPKTKVETTREAKPKPESKSNSAPAPVRRAEPIAKPEPKPEARPDIKPEPKPLVAVAPPPADGRIDKQVNRTAANERAEAEYRQGVQAQRQGSADEALVRFRRAVSDQPEHMAARQALAGLLIELRRLDEAEAVLRPAAEAGSSRLVFATLLARLKVERGDTAAALEVLLPQSAAGDRNADYQGFVAVLLNRLGRHGDAALRYRAATRLSPNEARWWAGLGIALDADGKVSEARDAYQHARSLPGLPVELLAHIEQRLK